MGQDAPASQAMRGKVNPSKWVSSSGKVHHRRLRFWVGTDHETEASPSVITTLCGSRQRLTLAGEGAVVDCGVCLRAANTRAHLNRPEAA